MQYVFLAYKDEQQWEAMPIGERDALEHACHASEEDLHRSGHLFAIDDTPLITVRINDGMLSLNDSPLAETRLQLFFINARDLNDAIQIASNMPQARRGLIEVRSIVELDRSD